MAAALTAAAVSRSLVRCAAAEETGLRVIGGIDRVTMLSGDLLGGVIVVKGTFTDGSPMLAIPNYAG